MCPTLAVTVTMMSGMAMGLATMVVLICSNVVISLLRKIVPDKVRIPAYIVIVATFVTIVDMVMYKFLPDLHETLGVFIALIVVNCVILARAEAFASQNPVLDSAIDGLGMGIGFTISLTILGFVRELLGLGSVLGNQIWDSPIAIFSQPAGAFFTLGILMALFNFLFDVYTKRKEIKLSLQVHVAENSEQNDLSLEELQVTDKPVKAVKTVNQLNDKSKEIENKFKVENLQESDIDNLNSKKNVIKEDIETSVKEGK